MREPFDVDDAARHLLRVEAEDGARAVYVLTRFQGGLVVIETNDAQESGYTTLDAEAMWRRVIARGVG